VESSSNFLHSFRFFVAQAKRDGKKVGKEKRLEDEDAALDAAEAEISFDHSVSLLVFVALLPWWSTFAVFLHFFCSSNHLK